MQADDRATQGAAGPKAIVVIRKKEDRPEADEHSRSKTRNQRRIDLLRSTTR